VWIEGSVDPETGCGGVCLLDVYEDDTIIYVLQRDEGARADLLRVTDDPHLCELAHTVPPLPKISEEQKLSAVAAPAVIPFYHYFHGQPPFAQ
jgi:hypothetical protein